MAVAGSASAADINVSTWAELKAAVSGDPAVVIPPPTANPGDTVIVAAGLYATDGDRLDLYVPVTIRGAGSGDNPSVDTIFDTTAVTDPLDVDNRFAVVRVTDCVFEDMKIQNCLSIDGGAFTDSGPDLAPITMTFTNLTFENCTATGGSGGGVLRGKDELVAFTATNCRFIDCTATSGAGGAFNFDGGQYTAPVGGATATFTGCTFTNCDSDDDDAGAIYKDYGGTLTITDCTFEDCDARNDAGTLGDDAGAIFLDDDNAILNVTGSTFKNNTCFDDGGAIKVDNNNAVATIDDCLFDGNSAGFDGGHIHLDNSSELVLTNSILKNGIAGDEGAAYKSNNGNVAKVHITNCLFLNNTNVPSRVVDLQGGDLKFVNNTFVGNSCTLEAPLVRFGDNAVLPDTPDSFILSNNIFEGNGGGTAQRVVHFATLTAATNVISNNALFDNSVVAPILISNSDVDGGPLAETGRITADPALDGTTHKPTASSTAIIDQADPTQATTTDLEGAAIYGSARDVGAYEYAPAATPTPTPPPSSAGQWMVY
jgi:predicted outer membrane repeat protein